MFEQRMSDANSLHQVDELIKEYLLFRGFTNTFRAFESEIKIDKDKGFQVDKMMDELLGAVANGDIQALIDYYRYLDLRFFSRLDSRFQRTIKKFELCLLRHYLIHAIQHKRRDKVIEFFDTFGPELHGKPEWSSWFALPYLKNPMNDPTFEMFFSKQWVDNYTVSLYNFLATTFQNMPLPSLLSFNIDRVQRKTQQTELETLKNTVENQKATLETRENEIAKLKHEIVETRKEMTDGISLIRRRAASTSADQRSLKSIAASIHAITNNSTQTTSTTTTNPMAAAAATAAAANALELLKRSSLDATHQTNKDKDDFVEEGPFLICSQDEFLEHASAITHAKFSSQGDLIASCDMDNIVRIWSHKESSFDPLKIRNTSSNVLSLEWDARSDRFLYMGTDTGLIRVYNVDSKSITQEFVMDEAYPWVTQLSSSPVEPIFVCSGSSNQLQPGKQTSNALVAWSMKAMSSCGSYEFNDDDQERQANGNSINIIKLNHNGQMVVVGDTTGYMRLFDIRSMKPIIEWKGNPSCTAQFSFDETSICSVDLDGQLSQWSIHKPGTCIFSSPLEGFPTPSTAYASQSKPSVNTSSTKPSSIDQYGKKARSIDNQVTRSLLSIHPRPQMAAFSTDTDYVLCASHAQNETFGSIYRVSETDSSSVLHLGNQPIYQPITTVGWTSTSNACLLGSMDGSIKVSTLIKV
ncbi:WD40-repeat-containing domain protein [Choanephora cucurbitarum]|nr:WD40-repeat-containing domain protein [Choanephora cucurbitarum]